MNAVYQYVKFADKMIMKTGWGVIAVANIFMLLVWVWTLPLNFLKHSIVHKMSIKYMYYVFEKLSTIWNILDKNFQKRTLSQNFRS